MTLAAPGEKRRKKKTDSFGHELGSVATWALTKTRVESDGDAHFMPKGGKWVENRPKPVVGLGRPTTKEKFLPWHEGSLADGGMTPNDVVPLER